MKLDEFLDKLDKRKTKVTLYKVYGIFNGTGAICGSPLPVDIGLDLYAISPIAAIEDSINTNGKFGQDAINGIIADRMTYIKDAMFGWASDFFGGLGRTDKQIVADVEAVDEDTFQFKGFRTEGGQKGETYAYVVEFTIPVNELMRVAPCYDATGKVIDPPNAPKKSIYLTLMDRQYEMDLKVYQMTGFEVQYNEKKGVKISKISLDEVAGNPEQLKSINPIKE